MDKTAETSADYFDFVEWFQVNRQRVLMIGSVALAIIVVAGLYVWHKNYNESESNAALAGIRLPANAQEASLPSVADPYLKVADQYPGTHGGERALLQAGGLLFGAGKFEAAHAAFERFLREYSNSPFANEALMGLASCLEAMGKPAEAATRYEDLINHHQADYITPQAKAALARCDVATNKPEKALALYQDLANANNNDTWSAEARMQAQQLLEKYPALAKAKTPPPAAAHAISTPSVPAVSVPPMK